MRNHLLKTVIFRISLALVLLAILSYVEYNQFSMKISRAKREISSLAQSTVWPKWELNAYENNRAKEVELIFYQDREEFSLTEADQEELRQILAKEFPNRELSIEYRYSFFSTTIDTPYNEELPGRVNEAFNKMKAEMKLDIWYHQSHIHNDDSTTRITYYLKIPLSESERLRGKELFEYFLNKGAEK